MEIPNLMHLGGMLCYKSCTEAIKYEIGRPKRCAQSSAVATENRKNNDLTLPGFRTGVVRSLTKLLATRALQQLLHSIAPEKALKCFNWFDDNVDTSMALTMATSSGWSGGNDRSMNGICGRLTTINHHFCAPIWLLTIRITSGTDIDQTIDYP